MDDLRSRREALGWSLLEVQSRTRIPLMHLEAIEEGRLEDLPDGPYLTAYTRTLRELGLLPDEVREDEAELTQSIHTSSVWAMRAITTVFAAVMLGVLVWAWQLERSEGEVVVAPEADQHVTVVARRNTNLVVRVDGKLAYDKRLPGGETLDFSAHDRIEVELPASENAKVVYNGEAIVPQGRQDAPRKLVFVDDQR